MDFTPLIRKLGREALIKIDSSPDLVSDVVQAAKVRAVENDAYRYGKTPNAIDYTKPLTTTAASVLHELGVATTLLTASPLAQVARHWAHVRYCATLATHKGRLVLSRYTDDVVYHHKVAQSEQIGIGVALIVAKAVLRQKYPGWEFSAVDAEVALKAGFLDGGPTVQQAANTAKRPDYILVGRGTTGRRRGLKYWILECKGTHYPRAQAIKQLATASVQVQTLEIGGQTPPSLMVASTLAKSGITAYVLDPPGDDDLWSGTRSDFDDLLGAAPNDHEWRPRTAAPPNTGTQPAGQPSPAPTTAASADPDELQPGPPDVYAIPEEQRSWFAQILTRASAAAALLFVGDSAAAAGYATPRQRGETPPADQQELPFDLDPPWSVSTAGTLQLPNRQRLQGTRFRTPLPDGQTLEIVRGMDQRLYKLLADGKIGPYLRAASTVYRRWTSARPLPNAAVSYGRDGTAVVIRVLDR